MALTRRQHEVYEFIRSFVVDQGYSPSLEEIASHLGLSSVATVHKHVQHLVEKGYLQKAWNRSRSVEPVDVPTAQIQQLPLLGIVAAGLPIEMVESSETIDVPAQLIPRRGSCFVLKVAGNSMIEEQICDGDFVVVESRPEASNGETVVALLRGEEVTLKKFYREGSQVRLQPANAAMQPIEAPAADVQIRGIVRGLLRQY
jgi:repressor LexA